MIVNLKGHHGTSFESAKKIQVSNYHLSVGDEEWLGDGVYFFVPGVSKNTTELAEKWAIAQAWDRHKKSIMYEEYCVLQSDIEVDEALFLDLTTSDGIEIMDYLVEKYMQKISASGKKLKFWDGFLLNLVRKEGFLPLEVAKGNFYIKFAKERLNRINLRTSNCTICAVYDPCKNITSNSIIKTGRIK